MKHRTWNANVKAFYENKCKLKKKKNSTKYYDLFTSNIYLPEYRVYEQLIQAIYAHQLFCFGFDMFICFIYCFAVYENRKNGCKY